MTTPFTLSVLVPVLNEEHGISAFYKQLHEMLQKQEYEYEIIFVDDGSTDNSFLELKKLHEQDPQIKLIRFSRNFGKEAALSACLEHATGDVIIPIDADLQHPVSVIPEFVAQWQNGYDMVCGRRISRSGEGIIKKVFAKSFYRLFNRMSQVKLDDGVGDFRFLDKKLVAVINDLPEKNRFMKGIFNWPGFQVTYVDYEVQERHNGQSKFKFWNLWNFALDGITSFTTVPLRLATYLGLIISSWAFLYGVYTTIKTLLLGVDVKGYASLFVMILFLGGVQLIFLGVIGEYLARIFQEIKGRPTYIAAEKIGFSEQVKENHDRNA